MNRTIAAAILTTLILAGCADLFSAPSGNAELASLSIAEGSLTPAFSPDLTEYVASVPFSVSSITLSGSAREPGATLAGMGLRTLDIGRNALSVTVTAPSGNAKTYRVTVTRSGDYVSSSVGTLIYVPAGTFQRDATAGNATEVSAFRITEKEITRAQFLAVWGADPSLPSVSTGMDDPVQNLNWYLAIAFCNKLSMREGLTPVYNVDGKTDPAQWGAIPSVPNAAWDAVSASWNASGYRLPTEAEWTWAAMGADAAAPGTLNSNGYLKAFSGSDGSNQIDDYAWYGANAGGKTRPAGSARANELGIFDMSGNVREWIWDWYAAYPEGRLVDYRGAPDNSGGNGRVHRGGGYFWNASYCAVSFRWNKDQSDRDNSLGLRLVRR
jgi:formylglycine-generating enzyme required for sulfatase activity